MVSCARHPLSPLFGSHFGDPISASMAVGVFSIMSDIFPPRDKPNPVPPVRRSDGTSRYNNRLDGISRVLDVPADAVKDESPLRSV